jgi:hypothetical protein
MFIDCERSDLPHSFSAMFVRPVEFDRETSTSFFRYSFGDIALLKECLVLLSFAIYKRCTPPE